MNWMILPLKRYADFKGRSRRLEFWMFALLNVIVIFGIIALTLLLSDIPADPTASDGNVSPVIILLMLWIVATIVPNIAVTVRRLHDQDKSGWLYLITLIPYIGWVFLLIFACVDGTHGPNQYGDDPKGDAVEDIFA